MQKQFLIALFCLLSLGSTSQNKPILYDFAEIPQSQLLNPALNFNHKQHIGIPLLSGLHAELGMKNFTVSDFFKVTSTSFSERLVNITNRLSSRDFLIVNGQLELVNIGFKISEKSYLSIGVYQETDMTLSFPKDLVALYLYGNEINRLYSFSDLSFHFQALGVFHAGFSRKIKENINVGVRLKLYSSFFQAQTTNTGAFTTTQGEDNLLIHRFNNINLNAQFSGIKRGQEDNIEDYFLSRGLTNNLGLGLDFGFVNQITPQLKLSASVLDLGFIRYSKRVNNVTLKTNFNFEGLQGSFVPENYSKSWEYLSEEIKENTSFEENTESYISLRPIKINTALKYSFGKYRSRSCYDYSYKKEHANAVGVQFFSLLRPRGPQIALIGFYERMLTRNFKTKITYTLDSYRLSNIGIGASRRIGKVNIYGTVGNLIQLRDLSKSNHVIAQMGINIIND